MVLRLSPSRRVSCARVIGPPVCTARSSARRLLRRSSSVPETAPESVTVTAILLVLDPAGGAGASAADRVDTRCEEQDATGHHPHGALVLVEQAHAVVDDLD